MAISQFNYDNELGEYGESIIKEMLKDLYGIQLYKGRKKWRDIDVDFIDNKEEAEDIKDLNSIYPGLKVEVKTDRSSYNNIATELVSNTTKNTNGWLFVTRADYLFIVRPALNRIYLFETDKLRNYVIKNKDNENKVKIRYTSTYDNINKNKLFYKTKLGILPIKELEKARVISAIYTLDTYKIIYDSSEYIVKQ